MIPKDFFKTCELLLKQSEEPHLRTAVGRSYYAAFLYFREYLRQHGLSKTRRPKNEAHEFVMSCLTYSGVPEANVASVDLRNLQQKRSDADYDLGLEVTKNDAEDALMLGKNVVATFAASINSDLTSKLISRATTHARLKDWLQ